MSSTPLQRTNSTRLRRRTNSIQHRRNSTPPRLHNRRPRCATNRRAPTDRWNTRLRRCRRGMKMRLRRRRDINRRQTTFPKTGGRTINRQVSREERSGTSRVLRRDTTGGASPGRRQVARLGAIPPNLDTHPCRWTAMANLRTRSPRATAMLSTAIPAARYGKFE